MPALTPSGPMPARPQEACIGPRYSAVDGEMDIFFVERHLGGDVPESASGVQARRIQSGGVDFDQEYPAVQDAVVGQLCSWF